MPKFSVEVTETTVYSVETEAETEEEAERIAEQIITEAENVDNYFSYCDGREANATPINDEA